MICKPLTAPRKQMLSKSVNEYHKFDCAFKTKILEQIQ